MSWNSKASTSSDRPTTNGPIATPPPTPAYELQQKRQQRANETAVRQYVVNAAIKMSEGKNWKPADVTMLIEWLNAYMTRGGGVEMSKTNVADESRPLPLP